MCAHFANIVCRCCLAHSLYVCLSVRPFRLWLQQSVHMNNKLTLVTPHCTQHRCCPRCTQSQTRNECIQLERYTYTTYIRTHIQRHFVSSVSHAQTCKPFAMNTRGEIEQENEHHAARWSCLLCGATEFRISCCCCWYRPLTQLLATQQLVGKF